MNTDWHRLFGLALCDLFSGSPWTVEMEKDLSLKKQFLDVVILRRGPGKFAGQLPDGLDHLTDHNLLSYKSLHEPLDDWSLKELTGHYVNYRKQTAPNSSDLAAENRFQMFGVSTRYPQKLAGEVTLEPIQTGVYQVSRGTDQIRIIVLSEIPRESHNSVWHLFSGVPEIVQFGAKNHQPRTNDTSTILNRLFENYRIEGFPMPYTMEDFRKEVALEQLSRLTPEERLTGMSPTDILTMLSSDERWKSLSAKERRALMRKLENTGEPGDQVSDDEGNT